jgi:hypothetical protein
MNQRSNIYFKNGTFQKEIIFNGQKSGLKNLFVIAKEALAYQ